VYFFVGPFIERMDSDAADPLRPALMAAALAQIDHTPWLGVGPNSYVEVVGAYDAVTAQGFPAHNTFLLMVAEVGIPLAVLFFIPFILLVWRAIRSRKTPGSAGAFSWAIIGATPGLLAITMTGWGMLSGFSLCLWMLVSGVALAQIGKKPKAEDAVLLSAAGKARAVTPA
jgi:O-antigen ligase